MGTRRHFEDLLRKLGTQPLTGCDEIAQAVEECLLASLPRTLVVEARGRRIVFGQKTFVMGIINATPDSFSGDGIYKNVEEGLRRAERMVEAGADFLDIGGESTRPGAERVPVEEELERTIPLVKAIVKRFDIPVSIDTYKARVAEEALDEGAWMVNDITALRGDRRMAEVVAKAGAPVVLMHMRGSPRTMQKNPRYDDVVADQIRFFRKRMEFAAEKGIRPELVILDPGIGFGKLLEHNLEIIRRLREYRVLGRPILVGPSRKSFIGMVLGGLPPEERLEGTCAVVALAIANGADIVRVHDVKEISRVARMADALVRGF